MRRRGRPIKDLTGHWFGSLIVLGLTNKRHRGNAVWECLCDCGVVTFVPAKNLASGNTRSCGCRQTSALIERAVDLRGKRFGLLTAIRPTPQRIRNSVAWECRCDCGKRVIRGAGRLPKSYSCGCTRRPIVSKYKAEKHWRWNGGRYKTAQGYIYVYAPTHPFKSNHGEGYVMEHRLVVEKSLGRYLTPKEVVHHIDADRANNELDNLVLFPNITAHLAHHRELKTVSVDVIQDLFGI